MIERTTVNSLLRCAQAYCNQLCDKQTLEYGIVYYCERFPEVVGLNQFREVIADGADEVRSAIRESQEWFTQQSLTCHAWAPALGQASAALTEQLKANGYEQRVDQAWRLAEWPAAPDAPQVRVLPARAMRAVYTELLEQSAGGVHGGVSARLERLDDPSLDMFVALIDKRAVGTCALYQVGDLAQVRDLWIAPDCTDPGVPRALLGHVLALGKRLTIANMLSLTDEGDTKTGGRLTEAGFVKDGTIETFYRKSTGA